MKAIVINPSKRVVGHHEFRSAVRSFYSLFNEPRQVGRLPNGDLVWADTDRIHLSTFSLGGGPQVVGNAVIVGKKDQAGDYTSPKSDPEDIRKIVRFAQLPPFEVETTPADVTSAIDQFVAELKSEAPEFVQVKTLAGSRGGRCWENVNTAVPLFGGHRVHGWAIWQRAPLFLTAEFHAVWCTPDNQLIDVTPKSDHEDRILFSPDRARYPANFDFLVRPANRRFRIYRVAADVSDVIKALSPSREAYEKRQAAKRGLSLEEHIASRVPLDPLETAIERLFTVCAQIDSLVQVTYEGLTSNHPHQVAKLDAEKMALHDEILRLAREKLADGGPAFRGAEP